MSIYLYGKQKKIKYQGSSDDVVIPGNLIVSGTSTLPGIADPTVTASATTFTVGTDLTVTNDATVSNDLAVTRDASVGRNFLVSGTAPSITITDTTNTVTAKLLANDTVTQVGASTNHALELITNNVARLSITNAGVATFSGTGLTLSNATNPTFTVTDTTNTTSLVAKSGDTTSTVGTSTSHSLILMTGGTTAVTIDTSQKATFAGAVEITGVQTFTGATTHAGLVTAPALTLTGASGVVLTMTDSTTPSTFKVTMTDTTTTLGMTTNHSLVLATNNTAAITIAGTQIATFAATPVMPALTLSGASGVVLTLTDTTTPSTLTITMADTTATIATTTAHALILNANGNTGISIASTGIATFAKAAVFTLGAQVTQVAITATVDGLTTGAIPVGTSFVVVTSSVATKIVTLPAGLAGTTIRGWTTANGHELQTPALSGATINGQDSDGTKSAAIPASTHWTATCVATDTWTLTASDALGAVVTAIVPD
jgi:hypothetical protein